MPSRRNEDGSAVADGCDDDMEVAEGHARPRSPTKEEAADVGKQRRIRDRLGIIDDGEPVLASHVVHLQLVPKQLTQTRPQGVLELLNIAYVVRRVARSAAPVLEHDARRESTVNTPDVTSAAEPGMSRDPATSRLDITNPLGRITRVTLARENWDPVRTQMLERPLAARARMRRDP